MPIHDPDQEKPVEDQAAQTLAQKVKALQERVRKMEVVSDGSTDKAFRDEAWGENSDDAQGWALEALHAAINTGLNSGPSIPVDQVFAELRARNATKS